MKPGFSRNFPKILKYQISWKSSEGDPSSCMRKDGPRQIDRHDEGNSCFPQFCERA